MFCSYTINQQLLSYYNLSLAVFENICSIARDFEFVRKLTEWRWICIYVLLLSNIIEEDISNISTHIKVLNAKILDVKDHHQL